jgi:hypothetical protein
VFVLLGLKGADSPARMPDLMPTAGSKASSQARATSIFSAATSTTSAGIATASRRSRSHRAPRNQNGIEGYHIDFSLAEKEGKKPFPDPQWPKEMLCNSDWATSRSTTTARFELVRTMRSSHHG